MCQTGKEGIIPQAILPLIPEGASQVSDWVSVHRDGDSWTYFVGIVPMGRHAAGERRSFQLMTSQLIDAGTCRQAEVIRAFGVSKSSVARALRRYREGGPAAFFQVRRGARRGGTVLTDDVLTAAQRLLDDGGSRAEVADELAVKDDTLRKALTDGRLREPSVAVGADKSSRSVQDAAAAEGMGTACTRTDERLLVALGKLDGATTRFEACRDVPYGAVLCALPALVENGLLDGVERFLNRLKGYYGVVPVLILMGLMALCRIKTVEQLRSEAPGEFGKLLGLDRIPEVRCLRRKLSELADKGAADRWAAHLRRQWMEAAPEAVGALYVDGHVRVYHGSQTALPRRYVSRQRLCLRGTTDYWVNDALGRPFFVVEKVADPGLLETLRIDIVPRLLVDVPAQPSPPQLNDNPYDCRFVLVFDREGYSPGFFRDMWTQHRIACITYHKHPRGTWPVEWFRQEVSTMPDGQRVTLSLAERGSLVGSGKEATWMREVRKLTESDHQVSLISTAFALPHTDIAARLFTRWCQENFLRYMRQHFALDLLTEYATEPLPDTERVINPDWRDLNKRRNSLQGTLNRRNARFAALTLHPQPESPPARFQKWTRRKAELLEQIEHYEEELKQVKQELSDTEHHIRWDELPEQNRFQRLGPTRRHLIDTVRMIAYRAETAMVPLLTDQHTDSPAARTILQALFRTAADIIPEPDQKRLRVLVHPASRPATDRRLLKLCDQLNEMDMVYPGTDLTLTYELVTHPLDPPENGVTLTS
ncbi:MAG: putative transposase [Thermoanaerobaculia bacterium]